jgi:peptide/nickel transport system permease protein
MTLNFFLPRLMPGNPLDTLVAKTKGKVSRATLEQMLTAYGYKPNRNVFVQYFDYLGNMATGNWGVSISANSLGTPITKMIGQALPWTIGLVGITTVLAFLIGSWIGTVGAWRRGGVIDSVLPSVFVISSALPYFVVGLLLLLLFNIDLNWLPATFNYDNTIVPGFSPGFVWSVIQHGLLPAVTLLIVTIGGWVLTQRNNMITVVAEDYVRMARAKGLPNRKIMYGYAARNAILPNLSGLAMSLGFVMAGAILIEFVFNYPGLGYMLINAVDGTDYPMMQALFMLFTVATLIGVLVSDFVIVWLDPRSRAKEG